MWLLFIILNLLPTIESNATTSTISTQSLEQQLQAKIIQKITSYKSSSKPIKILPRKSLITIVIDPGHGGHDPGAVNNSMKVQEKEITLSIAKQLAQELRRYPGFHVILTRTQDIFIPLRERLNIARAHKANLFLSIHADGFIHSHARGASVFTLSLKGSTSEAARWLAQKENYSELGGANLYQQDNFVRSALINFSQTLTLNQSAEIGQTILRELGKITLLHQPVIEKAAFIILQSPDIPSLLIETGFLSNPFEARQLTKTSHQIRLSKAIARGIHTYFQQVYKNKATKLL